MEVVSVFQYVLSYLPLLHFILLFLVLLYQVIQNFGQTLGIDFQGRNDILHGSLDENPVNQTEALPVLGERGQGLENQSDGQMAVSQRA